MAQTDLVKNKIADIQAKLGEQQLLLKTLDMWSDIQSQGIDPENVKSFGFSDAYVDAHVRNSWRKQGYRDLPAYQRTFSQQFHNYVRLKDDSIVVLKCGIRRPEFR